MPGATSVLSRKTGVITGEDSLKLFQHAQENSYAIPAINVTSSSTVVAALEAARDAKSPIILQVSQGGAAYFAGKGVSNDGQAASIAGAVAAAHYIRFVAHHVHSNVTVTDLYKAPLLHRMAFRSFSILTTALRSSSRGWME